jgi:hypothetical protein
MTQADPIRRTRRHNSDVPAQATAGESLHAASPLESGIAANRATVAGYPLAEEVGSQV